MELVFHMLYNKLIRRIQFDLHMLIFAENKSGKFFDVSHILPCKICVLSSKILNFRNYLSNVN